MLSGTLAVGVGPGQFTKIEPGIGKLLGVLSLQALPRRITLDFRDVFSEGFAFDSIDGNVKIWINGNLCTDRKNDEQLARRGVFGLQLHSGGAQEVRFKEIKLEVIQKK